VESHGWYRLAPFLWSPDEGVLRRKELLPEDVAALQQVGTLEVSGVLVGALELVVFVVGCRLSVVRESSRCPHGQLTTDN